MLKTNTAISASARLAVATHPADRVRLDQQVALAPQLYGGCQPGKTALGDNDIVIHKNLLSSILQRAGDGCCADRSRIMFLSFCKQAAVVGLRPGKKGGRTLAAVLRSLCGYTPLVSGHPGKAYLGFG
jgi:hypothetical protein